jgi:hypothetical protein
MSIRNEFAQSAFFLKVTYRNINGKTNIIKYTGPLEKLLGWTKKEFINQSYLKFIHPDDNKEYVFTLMKQNSNDRKLIPVRYIHNNGTCVKILVEGYSKNNIW